MIRLEVTYDPNDRALPLKLHCPSDVNPALVVCLLSQIITGLSMGQIPQDSKLIIPAGILPKVQ